MYNHLLYTFIQVADCGSFSKAAGTLYISPIAVMKQINALEGHLGLKLLERTSQGVFMTPAGESIYNSAREIMKASDEAVRKAREIARAGRYTIKIGTSILRPCKTLINLWNCGKNNTTDFQLEIIPFDDSPSSMAVILDKVDCFVSPCDSRTWRKKYNVQLLGYYDCQLAVPKKHRLAGKNLITWEDLNGESIMLVKKGESLVLDRMRTDIQEHHPDINIIDIPNFYDTAVFNECERLNCVMETLGIWAEVHPSIITIPVEWDYRMPYGIISSKRHNPELTRFIQQVIYNIAKTNGG